MRGFGAVWCAVLTFFMFFVSGSHDFAFVLDPEFIFSVQTIQTSYSFCPKSPYYPLKPNSSQNFMVRDEISFFEPNPSVNSYGLNRSFFSLDQKPHILSQSPHKRSRTSHRNPPHKCSHTARHPKIPQSPHKCSRTIKKPPQRATSLGRAVFFTSLFIWLLLPLRKHRTMVLDH